MAGKKERQRKLARERYQRRQARQAQRDRRARQWTIAITAVIVVGRRRGGRHRCSPAGPRGTSATSTPKRQRQRRHAEPRRPPRWPSPATHCTYTASRHRRAQGRPARRPRRTTRPATRPRSRPTAAPIVIDLLNSKATCTVNSFVYLADAELLQQHPVPPAEHHRRRCTCCSAATRPATGPAARATSSRARTSPAPRTRRARWPWPTRGAPDTNGSQFFLVYKNSYASRPTTRRSARSSADLISSRMWPRRGYGPPLNSARRRGTRRRRSRSRA